MKKTNTIDTLAGLDNQDLIKEFQRNMQAIEGTNRDHAQIVIAAHVQSQSKLRMMQLRKEEESSRLKSEKLWEQALQLAGEMKDTAQGYDNIYASLCMVLLLSLKWLRRMLQTPLLIGILDL